MEKMCDFLIRSNADPQKSGVVFFADDDNTYSLQLFKVMRRGTTTHACACHCRVTNTCRRFTFVHESDRPQA